MPIEFTVTQDFETFENFLIFSMFKGKRYKTAKTTFFIPAFILIPLTVIAILLKMPSLFSAFLISFSIVTFLLFGFLFYFFPKIQYKKLPKIFLEPQNYSFYEDYFEVNQKSEVGSGNTKLKYSELFKVYETHHAFYLFISQRQAFIVPKKCFNYKEQVFEISKLLHNVVEKKKYIVCF